MAANGWDKLGLTRDPLADGPVPWHFHREGSEQQFEQLAHRLAFSGLAILVSGPRGVGKTRHAKRFQEYLRPEFRVLAMTANAGLSLKHLLAGLCHELDLELPATDAVAALARQFSEREWPQQPVLLLDSAELLSDEILTFLLDLTQAQQTLGQGLRLLMYGEDSLIARLNPTTKLLYVWPLPKFSSVELKDYLLQRLQRCGFQGPWPIDARVWDDWSQACHGAPGQLRARVPELQQLLVRALKPQQFSWGGRLQRYWHRRGKDWFILILSLLLIVPLLVFQDDINGLFNREPKSTSTQPMSTKAQLTSEAARPAVPQSLNKTLDWQQTAAPLPPLWSVDSDASAAAVEPATSPVAPQPEPESMPKSSLFSEDEQQILLRDPDSFVIWFGIASPEKLRSLDNPERQSLRYSVTEPGKQGLIWGQFSSKSQAQQALKLWSVPAKDWKPQVRKISQIQSELRQAKSD